MSVQIDRGSGISNRSEGTLLCSFFVLRLGRGLLRQVAILRNRFARQNDRRIACGRTVFCARTRGRTRLRMIDGRLFYRHRGLDLWLWPVVALVSLIATSATTTTAPAPGPCSFRRIPVLRGRGFGSLACRLLLSST